MDGLIGCTQPRRIAATTVAQRIADADVYNQRSTSFYTGQIAWFAARLGRLFTFSLGMTTLLVVIGLSAGTVSRLPRAGTWMVWVKKGFAFAMLVGVVVGTYSSIFVASPALLEIQKRSGTGDLKERDRARRRRKSASVPV